MKNSKGFSEVKTNPFVFGKIVKGSYFLDRKAERKDIAVEIKNHTNVVIYSPRRYGKTSLVMQVFEDLKKENRSFAGLMIDFYRINTKDKFLLSLTNEYAKNSGLTFEKLLGIIRKTVKGITPLLEIGEDGSPKISLNYSPPVSNMVFENIIRLPKKIADSGKLVCVFFDEFQEITSLNGNNFQKELRAEIQHHDNVSYIFSGSKYHLFMELFENENNPLFNIGKIMSLKPIDAQYYNSYILKHFKKINSEFDKQSALKIYQLAGGIPYYVQMLAHETFNLAILNEDEKPDKLIAMAEENIISNKNDEFLLTYENLNLSSRVALDIIIKNRGKSLFRKNLIDGYPIAASTLKKALNTLMKKGIIVRSESEYNFQDIFFKRWVEKRL